MGDQFCALLEFAKKAEGSCAASNANVFTAVFMATVQANSFGLVFWLSCSPVANFKLLLQGLTL